MVIDLSKTMASPDLFLEVWDNWFYKKYFKKLKVRFFSFKVALNLLLQRGGKHIVETGSVRKKNDWGSGMSTLIFGDFCKRYNKYLWTVDIDPKAIKVAREVTKRFDKHITYAVDDSIDYLTGFGEKIDFLYLDSLDCETDPNKLNELPQIHQLNEVKAAWDKLGKKPIILLDDNNWLNGGKTKMAKAFLKSQGWTCLLDYCQSLWIKE